MNPNDWWGTPQIAEHQSQPSLNARFVTCFCFVRPLEGQEAEVCPTRWEAYVRDLF
jgi:hypothetical protein